MGGGGGCQTLHKSSLFARMYQSRFIIFTTGGIFNFDFFFRLEPILK